MLIVFKQAEKEQLDICNRVKDGMKVAKDEAARHGIKKQYGHAPGTKLITKKRVIQGNHNATIKGLQRDPGRSRGH